MVNAINKFNFNSSHFKRVAGFIFIIFFNCVAVYACSKFIELANSSQKNELYLVIIILTLAFVLLSRCLVRLASADLPRVSTFKGLIYSSISALSIALVFGPKALIKFYEYDDWVYLGFKYHQFDLAYLNETINFHYVPVLKAVLYAIDSLFLPNYLSNGIAFLFFLVFCVTCLLELCLRTIKPQIVALLMTVLFAVWPTAEMSRYWFGGGFWLLFPIPFYLLLLMRVQDFTTTGHVSKADLIASLILATLVVLSSSQIIIPAFGISIYIISYRIVARQTFSSGFLKAVIGCIMLILVPTALALYMRSGQIKQTANFSGLLDGSFFINVAIFIKLKLIYSRWVILPVLLLVFLCVAVIGRQIFLFRRNNLTNGLPAPQLALFFTALGCFILYVLQVGVARSWETYAVVTPYYASYPLISWFVMAVALIGASLSTENDNFLTEKVHRLCSLKYLFVIILSIVLIDAGKTAFNANRLTHDDYLFVKNQRDHVAVLGAAGCDLLARNTSERILLMPSQKFTSCSDCLSLFKAPQSFIDDFSKDDKFFRTIVKRFSEQFCEHDSKRFAISPIGDEFVTTGVEQSPLLRSYYKTYYTGDRVNWN